MNIYRIFDKELKRTQIFNLDIVKCFVIDDNCKFVHFFYSEKDTISFILTDDLTKKLKEIGVLE